MEDAFNISVLLQTQNNANKHKSKPSQFVSVAEGVKKRLESNVKTRRSSRLTIFDNFRKLPRCKTPPLAPLSKVEQRTLQLQKWKEEREKKKKEALLQKKKPFLLSVAINPQKFESVPPIAKPSTSGRVTRSQHHLTKKNQIDKKYETDMQSFAPVNAGFNPTLNPKIAALPRLGEAANHNEVEHLLNKEQKNDKTTKAKATEKLEPRSLRSRTKFTDSNNDAQKHIPSSSKTTESNTVKKSVPKSKVNSVRHNKESKSIRNIGNSSSSDTETNLKEVKSKVSTTKTSRTQRQKQEPRNKTKLADNNNTQKELKSSSVTESNVMTNSTMPKSRAIKNSVRNNKESKSKKTLQSSSSTETNEEEILTTNMDSEKVMNNTKKVEETEEPPSLNPKSPQIDCGIVGTPKRGIIQDFITFSPNNYVPKSESSSEEKLRSPQLMDSSLTPKQVNDEARKISPRVCLSRGKENTRREMKEKIKEGLLDEDTSDMSVEDFKRQLDSEIKRMTEMCETWDKISEQTTLPENIQEAVLSAVGQARLLMSKKLQQFASLLSRAERPSPGHAPVTAADLQGFWDMVFMQVENIDMRFKKLEQARARGWAEEQPPARPRKPPPRPPARAPRPPATSGLKDIIAAARKAKKEDIKTFDAGFFSVQSPVKSPSSLATPTKKPSLLKEVLSNEAKKASAKKSSYAILRVSSIGKDIEHDQLALCEGNATPLTPIDLGVTPGKSILKSNKTSVKKRGKKSIKVVLFDDDPSSNEVLKELEQNSAEESSPVTTRSRRRRTRGSEFIEVPKRSSRRKKSLQEEKTEETPKTTRSRRRVSAK